MSNDYILPPEWAPQDAILLTWPHAYGDWAAILPQVEREVVELAKAICRYESLIVACYNDIHRKHVHHCLTAANIHPNTFHLYITPSNDTWARDHGPITVFDKKQRPMLLDFQFNGWGNKYPSSLDNALTAQLYGQQAFPKASISYVDFVLEGGSIEVDGNATLLTTTSCLLSKNRNGQGKDEISRLLQQYLGVENILWLSHGLIPGDDTDGHIDTLARFANTQTLCYVKCSDTFDSHYSTLQAMESQLQTFRNNHDVPYTLVPLPWPRAQYNNQGVRLPLTYANFLILNNGVLVPNFADPADKIAENVISELFPQREIIGIPSTHIIQQFGSIHCLTMQIPAGVIHHE